MTWNNRVVWSEGMFLRPQHFQQQNRYQEWYTERRCAATQANAWGLSELKFDEHLLKLGKIGLSEVAGIFPDGMPFNAPHDDVLPEPLDISGDLRDTEIFLALPLRRVGGQAVAESGSEALARYISAEDQVRDVETPGGEETPIQIGHLAMRFVTEADKRDGYTCIGVAKVVEVREDKTVVLADKYYPSVQACRAAPGLQGFITELQGLLHHRGEALAARVTASGRGGSAEIADFLMLQAINRYQPLIYHLAKQQLLHPEDFYRLLMQITGELSTFTHQDKRPLSFEAYQHENLWETFKPVIAELRQSLSMVLEQNAIAIPLQERKFGIRVGVLTDRSLLDSATFVLAVHADIGAEELQRRFPMQVKIGPVEQIRDLVMRALPGIRARPLPVAPRQIPYHSGYAYFELDRGGEYWKMLQKSGGFAIHVGGDFPGLEMEFWAIKA